MSAVERAAQLGTEHGTRAAEAWLDLRQEDELAAIAAGYPGFGQSPEWPQPDLSQYKLYRECGVSFDDESEDHLSHDLPAAYEAAFTAAVEATIRQATTVE